jgi:predicted dehydrogenase
MADLIPVNVAIIGCGLIGAQWDALHQPSDFSLTHAAGYTKHRNARVVAMCDHDLLKAEQAVARWSGLAYTDPVKLFSEQSIDLAVIAVSSAARWAAIAPALAARVKVLVIEKPLATTLEESRTLTAAITQAGVKSVVNFSRRWDPSMRQLRDRIRSGELGEIQRLVGTYGKGITNNGSHMIDLAALLCDAKPTRARCLGLPLDPSEASWSDGKDPAFDAQIIYADQHRQEFNLTMLATDQRAFTCFELRLIGTHGTVELSLGGRQLSFSPVGDDPNYGGYKILTKSENLPARLLEAMDEMVDESLQLASGQRELSSCDVETALQTSLTVDALMRSATNDGRWMTINS